jgi:hypothetical protein
VKSARNRLPGMTSLHPTIMAGQIAGIGNHPPLWIGRRAAKIAGAPACLLRCRDGH